MSEASGGTGGEGGEGGAGAGAAGGGAGAAAPWHGYAETDADALAYITTKGWQGPQDVVKSYQNAEKLIGRDPSQLLVMPRADDPAGMRSVLQKLGLPETPDKYEFAAPVNGLKPDEAYQTWARSTFHEVGLLPAQVKALSEKHNAYVASIVEQQQKDYELSVASDKAALAKEWGAGAERMFAAAKHAANALGFTQEMVDAIERTTGYAGTHKFFAALGQKMGEHKFVSGDGKPAFDGQVTPAEAKAQWEAMKLDPVAQKALFDVSHPSHKELKAKQSKLFAIMYPES